MTENTQADREALAAIDDALGFLTDPEREVVLQSSARHRAAAVAEKDAEILRLKAAIQRQASAVRSLRLCEDTEINILRSKSRDAHAAVATLDSEREANSILTDEITTLRAKLDEARGLLGRIKESDEQSIREMAAMGIDLPDESGEFAKEIGAFLSGEAGS